MKNSEVDRGTHFENADISKYWDRGVYIVAQRRLSARKGLFILLAAPSCRADRRTLTETA